MKQKRISFEQHSMAHLYEMSLEHLCAKECDTCSNLKKRIETFLGKKEVDAIKRLLRKHGYCNKLTI